MLAVGTALLTVGAAYFLGNRALAHDREVRVRDDARKLLAEIVDAIETTNRGFEMLLHSYFLRQRVWRADDWPDSRSPADHDRDRENLERIDDTSIAGYHKLLSYLTPLRLVVRPDDPIRDQFKQLCGSYFETMSALQQAGLDPAGAPLRATELEEWNARRDLAVTRHFESVREFIDSAEEFSWRQ